MRPSNSNINTNDIMQIADISNFCMQIWYSKKANWKLIIAVDEFIKSVES